MWRRIRALANRAPSPSRARHRASHGAYAAGWANCVASAAFVARNHRVEDALAAAIERNDYRPFETLLTVLARPFDDQPEHAAMMAPPSRAAQRRHQTFCGT